MDDFSDTDEIEYVDVWERYSVPELTYDSSNSDKNESLPQNDYFKATEIKNKIKNLDFV